MMGSHTAPVQPWLGLNTGVYRRGLNFAPGYRQTETWLRREMPSTKGTFIAY